MLSILNYLKCFYKPFAMLSVIRSTLNNINAAIGVAASHQVNDLIKG
jgi:hypothetical protein